MKAVKCVLLVFLSFYFCCDSSASHNCPDVTDNATDHHHQTHNIEDTIVSSQNSSTQQKRGFTIGNVTKMFKDNFKSLSKKVFGKRDTCKGCNSSNSPNLPTVIDPSVSDIPKKLCCSNPSPIPIVEKVQEVNDNVSPTKEKRKIALIISPGENKEFHNTVNASSLRKLVNTTHDKEILSEIKPEVLKEHIRIKRDVSEMDAGNDKLNKTKLFFIEDNKAAKMDGNNQEGVSEKCKEKMKRLLFNNDKSERGIIRLFYCFYGIKTAANSKGYIKSAKLADIVPGNTNPEKQLIEKNNMIAINSIYGYNDEDKQEDINTNNGIVMMSEADNDENDETEDTLDAKLKADEALRFFIMKLQLSEKFAIFDNDEENVVDEIGVIEYITRTMKAIYVYDYFYLEIAGYLLAIAAFLMLLMYLLLWLARMNIIPSTIVAYRATRR